MTRTCRRLIRAAFYAAALLMLSTGPTAPALVAQVVPPCGAYDYACASPGTIDPTSAYDSRYFPSDENDHVAYCLVTNGYRGLANDGVEAIYAPHAAIEACSGVSL